MFFDKIKKLFIGGEWSVAYKEKESDTYKVISLPKGLWAADPMLFEHNNTHYLFAEIYENKKRKAGLGYFEFIDGTPVYKGLIIENDYHMSYPCVFEYKGSVYMIPESSANNSLELYKAVKFPNEWKKESIILDNCNLVDTTVFVINDIIKLLSYRKNKDNWELILFSYDLEKNTLHEESSVFFKTNIGRPAGYLLKNNDAFIRPAQDSGKKYGENILMYKIKSFSPYDEEEIDKIAISDVSLPKKAQRIHTYGEDSKYCVIDFFTEKFELFKAIDIYKRSHFKKKK